MLFNISKSDSVNFLELFWDKSLIISPVLSILSISLKKISLFLLVILLVNKLQNNSGLFILFTLSISLDALQLGIVNANRNDNLPSSSISDICSIIFSELYPFVIWANSRIYLPVLS